MLAIIIAAAKPSAPSPDITGVHANSERRTFTRGGGSGEVRWSQQNSSGVLARQRG